MKALWSGFLCLGRLDIPVKLYSATRDRSLKLTMLDKTDLTPLGYAWVRKDNRAAVDPDNIGRGFEVSRGEYILLEDEDFRAANVRKTEVIEILNFSEERTIDTIYFQKPYYLEPEEKAERIYVLLREALRRSGRVGIARFVFRNREHVAVLKVEGKALVLNQLRYHADIQPFDHLNIPLAADYSNREMDTALSLVERLTRPFDPRVYKDSYAEELRVIINDKAAGKMPEPRNQRIRNRALTDDEIIPLLEESLDQTKEEKDESN